MIYKILLVAGIALGPFTDWFSLYLGLVAGVALALEHWWARLEVQEEVPND